jgi:hypothetical protein
VKYIVAYDTTNGDILRLTIRSAKDSVIVSENGTLNNSTLTGPGFALAELHHVITVVLEGRTMRSPISEIVSGTEVLLGRLIDTGGENKAVTYEVNGSVDDDDFTPQNKADEIASVKTEVGHDNVDALVVSTQAMLGMGQHYVDLADGNKIKSKLEQITYQ